MENENMTSLKKSLMMSRIPRGRHLPLELLQICKIKEGRNTLRAISIAYGINQGNLSRVISGKRNTKTHVQILEMEFGISIEEIRAIWKRDAERKRELGKTANELKDQT
ncbi:hypothetical protein Q4554_14670 [Leptospira santarosai]|uniref:hypothetical protein n=1 Tax=Leptospira santarosai TaxID=28183 RepID=UPI0026E1BDB6|nr:hypothetical protein [Leptospira santarosai]MDO6395322.1 hypothetical protein [Leptospira santarosai]